MIIILIKLRVLNKFGYVKLDPSTIRRTVEKKINCSLVPVFKLLNTELAAQICANQNRMASIGVGMEMRE